MLEQIQAAAQWISTHTTLRPTVAIVLGTGLGRLAEEIEVVEKFSYADIPHFPRFHGRRSLWLSPFRPFGR